MKGFWVLLIGFVLLNSGCAFTPQAVVVKPELKPVSRAAGHGQPLMLTVVDERPRTTLGTRGAQGIGAELTVAGDLSDIIRKALSDGLQRQGFKPTMEKPTDGRELRVEIRNLDYRILTGFFSGTLSTECGLKAVCIHGPERPFEYLYRGDHQESILAIQTDGANEEYINTAVSEAINSLLNDFNLTKCLEQ